MKKKLCVLFVLLLACSVFCEQQNESVKPQVNYLIKGGLLKNVDAISTLSNEMSISEKYEILNTYQRSPVKPILINLGAGFGIGSYIDGDKKGGTVGLIGDIVSTICWITAITNYTFDSASYISDLADYQVQGYYWNGGKKIYSTPEEPTMKCAFAVIATLGSRVYQCIRANSYVKKYNQTLTEALGINSLQTSLLPVINDDGSLAMSLNFSIKL